MAVQAAAEPVQVQAAQADPEQADLPGQAAVVQVPVDRPEQAARVLVLAQAPAVRVQPAAEGAP